MLILSLAMAANLFAADRFETPDRTRNAFGQPFPSLTFEEKRQFSNGNSFFRQAWVKAGASTTARDGLGPTFNAVSCSNCHALDGRGPGAFREGPVHVSLLFRLQGAEDAYGDQLNPGANVGVEKEATPYAKFAIWPGEFEDGELYELREPRFEFMNWMFGTPAGHTRISARVAMQTIGLGLLERIPAAEIENKADPDDRDGNGISGKTTYVLNLRTGALELGRFGWKNEQPTVEQQAAAAFIGDMGLTSELFPVENCPLPQLTCQFSASGGTPEVDAKTLAQVSFYMRTLAVPSPRPLEHDRGAQTFSRIGCANCHHPSYVIDGTKISPFTDMLLHDMGSGLADRTLAGSILQTEWRTPPLWGIGLLQTVSNHTNLLHDGRARGVQEAILWHDGEGRNAREAYMQLTREQRAELIEFVHSL